MVQWTKTGLFLPQDGMSSRFLRYICNSSQTGSAFCQVLNFYVFGYSEKTNLVSAVSHFSKTKTSNHFLNLCRFT